MNIHDLWQKKILSIQYYHIEGNVTDIYDTIITKPILPIQYAELIYSNKIWYGVPYEEKYRKVAWINKPEDMHIPFTQFVNLIDFKINYLNTGSCRVENTFITFIFTSNLSLNELYPQLWLYKDCSHILNWIDQYHVEKVDSV